MGLAEQPRFLLASKLLFNDHRHRFLKHALFPLEVRDLLLAGFKLHLKVPQSVLFLHQLGFDIFKI